MKLWFRKSGEVARAARDAPPTGQPSGDQGTAWAAFAERQLADEKSRFSTLDNKGAALVTSSSSLVTLVLGIGALATSRTSFRPNTAVLTLATIGLTTFVLAAFAGLLATRALGYTTPSAESLEKIRSDRKFWLRSEAYARNICMWWDVRSLRTLRITNNKKAWWVARGRILQIAGTLFLTATAGVSFWSLQ